ncbi:molybdopterin synthase catalytic subunit [Thermogymnomonas acidicola]|uniref:Molybdopterin synthase catalytic subunit n=1 Tax=Thermogymnomonas acidicola TaxID=399579 RepID=A0AA37F9Q3_9ARCH|nr:molybdenum cofactor biosynthesis protein MoaE [Thermogymnomonas acidicola]GGM70984.1 molybdopterin synthase catalytic subunit [Thermogymnomonas acidicola]
MPYPYACVILITTDRIEDIQLGREVPDSDGAVVEFRGVVRGVEGDARIDHLEYEAYREMAERMLSELEERVRETFHVSTVTIIHRVGSVRVSEASVLIRVSAPHRRMAFMAAEYCIEEIKRNIPIWKKEVGSVNRWVHGDSYTE